MNTASEKYRESDTLRSKVGQLVDLDSAVARLFSNSLNVMFQSSELATKSFNNVSNLLFSLLEKQQLWMSLDATPMFVITRYSH